jgi:PST family polysaccharide transporter
MHIVAVDSLGILLQNSDYLLIGRFLGAAALGVYSLAFRIPDLLIMQFCWLISRVVFPLYSKIREEPAVLVQGFLTTLRYVALVTIPIGLGAALLADPLVRTLFSDKWVEAIPVLRAIAIYAVMLSFSYNAGDIYKAIGRPEIITRFSFGRLVVLLPALFWASSIAKSIMMVAYVQVVVALIFGIIGLYIAGRLIKTSFGEVWNALRPALISGFAMSLAVVASLGLRLPSIYQLIVSVLVGVIVYLSILLKFEPALIKEIKHMLLQYRDSSKVLNSEIGS